MIDAIQKGLFNLLSQSALLKRLASRYGMSSPNSFARRFIAGETAQEAIEVARTLQAKGFDLTLDYLGESVRTHQEADSAAREYVHLIDVLRQSGIERNISLKLTQLGAGVDRAIEPLEARGIIAVARGRIRVRERNVLRYYARGLDHLLASPSRHTH